MIKILIALLVVVAGALLWMLQPSTPDNSVLVAPDKRLGAVPRVDITPPKVAVYTAPAKRKMGVQADIVDDPNKYVLTSVKLPKQSVTVIIDKNTGDVQNFVREEPTPWLAVERTGEFGVGYGFKNGQRVAHLFAREELLQVKSVHFGGGLHWFTDGTNMAELTVSMRW